MTMTVLHSPVPYQVAFISWFQEIHLNATIVALFSFLIEWNGRVWKQFEYIYWIKTSCLYKTAMFSV